MEKRLIKRCEVVPKARARAKKGENHISKQLRRHISEFLKSMDARLVYKHDDILNSFQTYNRKPG